MVVKERGILTKHDRNSDWLVSYRSLSQISEMQITSLFRFFINKKLRSDGNNNKRSWGRIVSIIYGCSAR